MQDILERVAQEMRNRAIKTENELRRLMTDKGLTQQELIDNYTLVEWTKLENGDFGKINGFSHHTAIVPNENLDEFLLKIKEELEQS